MRELLFGGRYEAEIANEAGVSSRTVMRVARDAKVVGFDVLKDTHGRYYASLQ
jgi:DNA-binding MurR/RpiR family transcriptional regulator